MRAANLSATLAALYPTRQAAYLWGPPGVGKSSIVKQVSRSLGIGLIDVRAVLLDPVDLRGLPYVVDGQAFWASPGFLPVEGMGILFLDELAQAPPMVQSACLQLVLDRRLGEYVLPDGWMVIAASNRQEDRAGSHRLISSLASRFLHYDMEVHNDDWHSWALGAGIHQDVRSFMRFRPALLHQFDAKSGARCFPCPRSWEFVSRTLDAATGEAEYPTVAGCVGDGAAAEFVAYRRLCRDLPDPKQVLQTPESAPVPVEPAVLYALGGALVSEAKSATATELASLATYAGRLPMEFATMLMRDTMAIRPEFMRLPAVSKWVVDNCHTLTA